MLLETLFVGLVWSTWRNIIDDKGIVEGAFEIPTAELYQTRYALPPEQVFSFNLSCTAIDFRQCDAME